MGEVYLGIGNGISKGQLIKFIETEVVQVRLEYQL